MFDNDYGYLICDVCVLWKVFYFYGKENECFVNDDFVVEWIENMF